LSVLTQLRTKCLERIDALPITALEKLLEITFPYIGACPSCSGGGGGGGELVDVGLVQGLRS